MSDRMYNSRQRITMADLAGLAGVSKTVVSKIVNGVPGGYVSPAKRQEIEALIKRYNYTPLGSARSLATKKTGQIAFMLSARTTMGLGNQYYAAVLNGVSDVCSRHGYQCMLNFHDFSDIRTFLLPDNLRKLSIDGCVLTGFFDDQVLDEISSLRLPMVMIGRESLRTGIPVIGRNTAMDYAWILKYFSSMGHRRIWIAQNWKVHRVLFGELAGQFPELELTFLDRENAPDEFEYGRIHARRYLALPLAARPTLINGSDHFCAAFLRLIREHGLECPRDVSAFTNVESLLTEWGTVPLTSFAQDTYSLSCAGTELLIDVLNARCTMEEAGETADRISRESQSIFIDRQSVRNLTEK